MKFLASLGFTVLMAAVIGAGMVRMAYGKGAGLFICSLVAFFLIFAFIGCLPPKKQH